MTRSYPPLPYDNVIQNEFHCSEPQWIYDPVISQWRSPDHRIHRILAEANHLYHDWRFNKSGLFAPSPCPLWLDTGRILAELGLPWHNNQVNMPDQIDTSWPFHFKSFERRLLHIMGSRVGDPNASGYVSSYNEANCYCIRSLQQELRKTSPQQRPVLIYDHFNFELICSFEKSFGLEPHRVDLSGSRENLRLDLLDATSNKLRPIIFAVSIGNSATECDDVGIISELSIEFSIIMHVDAFRSFNYITTMPERHRRQEGSEKIILRMKDPSQPLRIGDGCVIASSIVGGGLNQSPHAPAVALTPFLHSTEGQRVAYIRSVDLTLGGSRDAISPLWLALYEMRIAQLGIQQLCHDLAGVRSKILSVLHSQLMEAREAPYCLDIIVSSFSLSQSHRLLKLGGTMMKSGNIILPIQTKILAAEIIVPPFAIASNQAKRGRGSSSIYKEFIDHYPIPEKSLKELRLIIQSWKVMTPSTAGYPLHMGSLSALGPVIGRFWELNIPRGWIENTTKQLLSSRLASFGVSDPECQEMFKGTFTNGSTMGNRCGIHTAFAQFPDAFIYFSTESHYSVLKTLRDCDTITNRWTGRKPQYSQIDCTPDGSICANSLIKQALLDKKECVDEGRQYQMILFINIGTTFVGARDNITSISHKLLEVGIEISYIHADGAFEFGFNTCGIRLGPPGAVNTDGMPLVQGVTISHHKALGQNVSGEVFCFTPNHPIVGSSSIIDPRIVLETWLYNRVYTPEDKTLMLSYCRENASLLESGLKQSGLTTKRNIGSIIVVFERPPAWIIEEFSLRPEGDWVHLITMPHVSPKTVSLFLDRLKFVDEVCSLAFDYISPLLSDVVEQKLKLHRVHSRGPMAERLFNETESLQPMHSVITDVSAIIKSCIRGALSIVAIDENGEIQIAFLAESSRDRCIVLGPLLINNALIARRKAITEIRSQLIDLMARNLKAELRIEKVSQDVYTFR